MPEEVKAYRCIHKCGLVRLKRKPIENHEERCFNNPATRSCRTCANVTVEFEAVDEDKDYRFNFCTFFEVELNRETLKTQCKEWKDKKCQNTQS